MRKTTHVVLVLACFIFATACVQVDDLGEHDLDSAGAGSRLDGYGSGWSRPPENWRHDEMLNREVALPTVYELPALPVAKIDQIKRHMTQAELFHLLGEPTREDVELQNVDSGGNDYNATVYTWRYHDLRHASHPIRRELEVRLAHVDNARGFPLRAGIVGPDWVVMSWDLF